jgi:phosphatidate phosphatase APP1
MNVTKKQTAMVAATIALALLSAVAINGLVAPGNHTAAAAEKKHPGIKLQPDSASSGSSVTVTGSEFKAKSTVKITLDGKRLKTDPTKVTTGSDGSFTTHIQIPITAKAGNHTIKASAGIFNSASATFTVTKK